MTGTVSLSPSKKETQSIIRPHTHGSPSKQSDSPNTPNLPNRSNSALVRLSKVAVPGPLLLRSSEPFQKRVHRVSNYRGPRTLDQIPRHIGLDGQTVGCRPLNNGARLLRLVGNPEGGRWYFARAMLCGVEKSPV